MTILMIIYVAIGTLIQVYLVNDTVAYLEDIESDNLNQEIILILVAVMLWPYLVLKAIIDLAKARKGK